LNILGAFNGNQSTLAPLSEPLHTLTYIRPGHPEYGGAVKLLYERLLLDDGFSELTKTEVEIAKEAITSVSQLLTGYQGKDDDVRHQLQQAAGRQRNLAGLIQDSVKRHGELLDTLKSFFKNRNWSVENCTYAYGETKNVNALFCEVIIQSSGYLKHVTRARALLKGRYQSGLERYAP
jgi:hypothetical protein